LAGTPFCLARLWEHFQLPVNRALTAPAEKQVHLGIEIGAEGTYTNIGVFNAGTVPATAVFETFQACDDALIDAQQLSIPPNTLCKLMAWLRSSRSARNS